MLPSGGARQKKLDMTNRGMLLGTETYRSPSVIGREQILVVGVCGACPMAGSP